MLQGVHDYYYYYYWDQAAVWLSSNVLHQCSSNISGQENSFTILTNMSSNPCNLVHGLRGEGLMSLTGA